MLAIESAIRELRVLRQLRALPVLTRAGLAVLVAGALMDLAAHLAIAAPAAGHGHEFTPAEAVAHVVVFAGMALVLLGVVVDGARRTRPGRSAGETSKGGT